MKLDNLDLMSREEMLEVASSNRVEHQYTTEDLWENEDHNYVVCNRNGYMEWANGEEVLEDDTLPEDGWFECTGYGNEEEDYNDCYRQMTYLDGYSDSGIYDDPLYDGEDEY